MNYTQQTKLKSILIELALLSLKTKDYRCKLSFKRRIGEINNYLKKTFDEKLAGNLGDTPIGRLNALTVRIYICENKVLQSIAKQYILSYLLEAVSSFHYLFPQLTAFQVKSLAKLIKFKHATTLYLSLIHISEPTRPY